MTIKPATHDITTESADQFRNQADKRALWRGVANSLLLHGLLLALLIGLWQVTPPDEIALPLIIVKFEGTGASGSPGGGGGKAPMPGQETGTANKPAAAAAPPPAPSVTPLQTAQAITPLQPPKPVQKLTPKPAQLPPPTPKPRPSPIVATVTPPPAPVKPAPPAAAPAPTQTTAAAAPAPPETQSVQNAAVASAAGAGQGSQGADSTGNGNVGRSQGDVGNGSGSGSGDDYLDLVRRHLNVYKKYPDEALKQKQEGTVLIGFLLAHDGTVTKAWVEKSSGNDLLDQAALAMMRDGSPVPPVPERYWDKTGPIILPVDFSIGFLNKIMN